MVGSGGRRNPASSDALSRSIFLSGPMGSGKSTVARAVGERVGAPVVDLDARVAEASGSSVFSLFAERGEAAFRALEREQLRQVLGEATVGGPCVVALGGGTVMDDRSRRRLLEVGILVTLTATADVLAERVKDQHHRPLLAGRDAKAVLRSILSARAAAYAECHATLDANRPVDVVAADVVEVVNDDPVPVPLGARTYQVDIGLARLSRLETRLAPQTFVVTDENVAATPWARDLIEALNVPMCVLPAGERQKTIRTVERIWDEALSASLDRGGLVVALGGGVVGDLVGFAASTLFRGVAFAQVPTTLLAMVDSSVGGKTGFDRSQGKNLVGTFHQPKFVLCDPATLSTLPDRELRAGLAEVVKSAWLDGEASVAALEADADALLAKEPSAVIGVVRRSVALKTRLVVEDETEAGVRRFLNLGHTVGHALEAAAGYETLLHGEAISLGLIASFRVARRLGLGSSDDAERMRTLLERFGLPTDLDAHVKPGLSSYWAHDKKRRGAEVGFVVPGAPGKVEVRPIPIEGLAALIASD